MHLDIVGASGFGYAFQDKIVALYEQDDYVFTTQHLLDKFAQDQITQIANLFNIEDQTQGCAADLQSAYDTLVNSFSRLQYFFKNQYIGNFDNLRESFYESCGQNVCKEALDIFVGMISGDGNNCDLP